jgi:hypothetical protein
MNRTRKDTRYEIPESAILSACIKWLWANGCFVWRNNSGGMTKSYTRKDGSVSHARIKFGLPGSADIIGVNRFGRFIAIECKREGKNLEPHQERFRDQVVEKGGVFVLARSLDDLEDNKIIITSSYPSMYAEGALASQYVKPSLSGKRGDV